MKLKVSWQSGMVFEAQTESGHTILMDGSPDIGGQNKGPRPMEMVLVGLGGCSSIDVMLMLNKMQPDQVKDCFVEIDAERADAVPAVFTKIHLNFVVNGQSLDERKVARAVKLSAEKYCSVSKMLENSVEITHSYEVREVD